MQIPESCSYNRIWLCYAIQDFNITTHILLELHDELNDMLFTGDTISLVATLLCLQIIDKSPSSSQKSLFSATHILFCISSVFDIFLVNVYCEINPVFQVCQQDKLSKMSTFPNEILWKKGFIFQCQMFRKVKFTINQHCFWKWLHAEQVPNYCLDQ